MAGINGQKDSPTLDLNFAKNKSLIDTMTGRNLVTFSRTQTGNEATYVGADGLIKYAAADEPRFDHDPVTGECLGLLVEEARTNQVKRSGDIFNYPDLAEADRWEIVDTTSQGVSAILGAIGTGTLTPNSAIAPDGTITASFFSAIGVNVLRSPLVTGGNLGQAYNAVTVNLDSGTIVSANENGSPATITPAGNGWYRITWTGRGICSVYAKKGSTNILKMGYGTFFGGLCFTFSTGGTEGQGVYIWGAQQEDLASFPTSYIPTEGTTKTRSADVASITGSNFSSWYNPTEGSFFMDEKNSYGIILAKRFELIQNLTPNDNSIAFNVNFGNAARISSRESGTTGTIDVSLNNSYTLGGNHKYGYGLKLNDTVIVSGSNIATDSNCTLPPNLDALDFGALIRSTPLSNSGGRFTLSRLTYWPERLPNKVLQRLTR